MARSIARFAPALDRCFTEPVESRLGQAVPAIQAEWAEAVVQGAIDIQAPDLANTISAADGSAHSSTRRDGPPAGRRFQRHTGRDRAAVVRAGLSRPRGQHGAADLARGADWRMSG